MNCRRFEFFIDVDKENTADVNYYLAVQETARRNMAWRAIIVELIFCPFRRVFSSVRARARTHIRSGCVVLLTFFRVYCI